MSNSRGFLVAFLAAMTALASLTLMARAQSAPEADLEAMVYRAVDARILPDVESLAASMRALAEAAESGERGAILRAYDAAYDSWARVSYLRFGATEEEGRGFAIAFWPDTKGFTQRKLNALIAAEDPVVADPEAFAEGSIAQRGLLALDYLLHDPEAGPLEGYRLTLVQAIAHDLARTAQALELRWRKPYAALLLTAGAPDNPLYASRQEAAIELYKALMAGLEFDADLRLGRPLGTFDRPRPRRAEAWRSGRSLRNLQLSLGALRGFYAEVFAPALTSEAAAHVTSGFDYAIRLAERAPEPMDEAVASPGSRLQIEAIKTAVDNLREMVATAVGPAVGAGVTFNSLDGD